jgi:hypothetical protein
MPRAVRVFFMHFGTLVPILTYFNLAERTGWSAPGVRTTLLIAFGVSIAYGTLARLVGELKQLDVGVGALFATGAAGTSAGLEPVLRAYQQYSPALLFTALGLTALLPMLFGFEPFTAYYGRRQTPAWQQKLPIYATILRLMSGLWSVLFFIGAGLAAWSPRDPLFTLLYPNLVTLGIGIPAGIWGPPLYLKLFPPPMPESVEPLLLGMPFVFDAKAARDARANIQFRVSGSDAGDYWLKIDRGRCTSAAGEAPTADLTFYTPDKVWVAVARGELDGTQALAEGLYRVEGDPEILIRFGEWFPKRG